jgi:hypothetical protein
MDIVLNLVLQVEVVLVHVQEAEEVDPLVPTHRSGVVVRGVESVGGKARARRH